MIPLNRDGGLTQRKKAFTITLTAITLLMIVSGTILSVLGTRTANLASPSSSLVQIGASFDGWSQVSGDLYPPDPYLAAGPNVLVEVVNFHIAMYSRQGTLLVSQTLATFFNTGSDSVFDPRVVYDPGSQRWYATVGDFSRGVVLAVSNSNDPTIMPWKLYSFSVASCPDQPRIGFSDDKLVVSANVYHHLPAPYFSCFSTFWGAEYMVINKNDLVLGVATPRFTTFGPDPTLFSVQPVKSITSTSTQFAVANPAIGEDPSNVPGNSTTILSITGVPGISNVTSTKYSVSVATMTPPPNAPQPGTSGSIDEYKSGIRIQDSAWYQGRLWYTLMDGCTPIGDNITRSCIRLTQLDTASSSVLQDFDDGTAGQYFFYPALSLDGAGNLLVVYGFSSSSLYPSIAVTGQMSTDLRGTTAPPVTLKSGTTFENTGRYGDYFAASLDPSNSSVVWVVGEYESSSTGLCFKVPTYCWATFIGSSEISPGPGSFTLATSPSSVTLACNKYGCAPGGNSTLTITSVNGFSGTVALTYIGPSNPGAYVTGPPSVVVSAGGSISVTITAHPIGAKTGTFVWAINGNSGRFSTNATLTVQHLYCATCL